MLSRLIFSIVFGCLLANIASAQQLMHCGTTEYQKEQALLFPNQNDNQNRLEQTTPDHVRKYLNEKIHLNQNKSAAIKVIPVVFHIIHFGGSENISNAQVQSALDVLNEDFRKLNADTVNTPSVFKPVAADSEIEFRLATLDPNGNCTDGIVRVYSILTFDGTNAIKALSYWPSDKYLNIWIAKDAIPTAGQPPRTGYAQFPGGNPLTDGLVLGNRYTGRIGTAANTQAGRWISHEAGHWFNLRHIWGDATCGNDFVADTPPHEVSNSGCSTFPHISTQCNNGPNGDMYMNYMDYSDGSCMNLFTLGQAARMDAALNSPISGRNNLWTASNLIATGTTGSPGVLCSPIAFFINNVNLVCEGTTVNFTDGSWNGQASSWLWDFPGGTPSSSIDPNPSIQYNVSGTYDVTVTVTNSAGSDSYTLPATVVVSPAIGQYGVPYSEGFETINFPGSEWIVENEGGNAWTQTGNASHSGNNSVYINNFTGNTPDASDVFITPTYNLTNVTSSNLTFWLAFAARSSTSTDLLRVFASTTCGQLWNVRYNKSGLTLSTAGLITSNFVPTSTQWRQETVNIASSTYNNKPNVRFKFEYIQSNGNNIYIDDINLNGTVGIDEVYEQSLDVSVYPNPVIGTAFIDFTLTERSNISIEVIDVMGKVVNTVSETKLDAGEYHFELPSGLAAGLYSVKLNVDGYVLAKKIIVN